MRASVILVADHTFTTGYRFVTATADDPPALPRRVTLRLREPDTDRVSVDVWTERGWKYVWTYPVRPYPQREKNDDEWVGIPMDKIATDTLRLVNP